MPDGKMPARHFSAGINMSLRNHIFVAVGIGGLLMATTGRAADLYVCDWGYVATPGLGAIYRFAPDGTKSTFASGLTQPSGRAFGAAGNLFASGIDPSFSFIDKYSPQGVKTSFVSGSVAGLGGLAFDSAGNLFVS